MKYIQFILLLWLLFLSSGCGSAKAIKVYNYPITKDNLEKTVLKVLKSNPHIVMDTAKSKVRVRRNPNNLDDTSTVLINLSDFHSPDSAQVAAFFKRYIKFKIKVEQIENYYEFHFLGDEKYWKSSPSSAILLSEVRDKHGNSISQGHNENGQFYTKMAKEFTALFEREVISKIDKELNLQHTVD